MYVIRHNDNIIGKANNPSNIWDITNQYLIDNNIPKYYFRMWSGDGIVTIDYGSHINFFFIEKDDGTGIAIGDLIDIG